jgi:hypothetical protein
MWLNYCLFYFAFYTALPSNIKIYEYTFMCDNVQPTSEVHINAARNAEGHADVTTGLTERYTCLIQNWREVCVIFSLLSFRKMKK